MFRHATKICASRIWNYSSVKPFMHSCKPSGLQVFGGFAKWPRTLKNPQGSPVHSPTFSSIFHRSFATQVNRNTVANNSEQVAPLQEDGRDRLYKIVELELKGHEESVLKSYQFFLCKAAKELGITVSRVFIPLRHFERFSVLKSAFIYKKHMVQYEFRTYFRVVQLKHLTGSTADTYLEYVQRNLPEGVAMKVITCTIEELPDSIQMDQNQNQKENSPQS